MLSRRLLRIKVLQIFYAHNKVGDRTCLQSESDLVRSIHKSFELFHTLILLMIEVRDLAAGRIELARTKKRPSPEDLNPNTRFIDNRLLVQIENNKSFGQFVRQNKLSWSDHPEIVRKLLIIITESETYRQFMTEWEPSYASDRELIVRIYHDVVMNFEDLYATLEEQNIFWIEDIDFIINMIAKTIRKLTGEKEGSRVRLPVSENKEDLEFSKLLLRKAVTGQDSCIGYIEKTARNWELERIAEIDRLIMILAITEAVEFDNIPTRVTMNEFIEIAKLFSTMKSSQFINGILDSIFEMLRSEHKINKKGRGLIGEQDSGKG